MKCSVDQCKNKAIFEIQWGLDLKGQRSQLCMEHTMEVWEKSHHAFNNIWIQREIGLDGEYI